MFQVACPTILLSAALFMAPCFGTTPCAESLSEEGGGYGYSERDKFVTRENVKRFLPLFESLKAAFPCATDVARMLRPMREALAPERRSTWDLESGKLGLTPRVVWSAADGRVAAGNKVVKTVLLYASLKGVKPTGDAFFRDERDILRLLGEFGYVPATVTKENFETFEPLLSALRETFRCSNDFERVTTAMRGALPERALAEWEREISTLGLTEDVAKMAYSQSGARAANRIVRLIEIYARLAGYVEGEANHFRAPSEFTPILDPFGYSPIVVTKENLKSFRPMLGWFGELFGCRTDIRKAQDAMRDSIPEARRENWDRKVTGLGLPPRAVNLSQECAGTADRVVKLIVLYSHLIDWAEGRENHFRSREKFEGLFAKFLDPSPGS